MLLKFDFKKYFSSENSKWKLSKGILWCHLLNSPIWEKKSNYIKEKATKLMTKVKQAEDREAIIPFKHKFLWNFYRGTDLFFWMSDFFCWFCLKTALLMYHALMIFNNFSNKCGCHILYGFWIMEYYILERFPYLRLRILCHLDSIALGNVQVHNLLILNPATKPNLV